MITEILTTAMLTASTPQPLSPIGDALPSREVQFLTEEEQRIRKNRQQRRAEAAMARRGRGAGV